MSKDRKSDALFKAASKGDLSSVKKLLKQGYPASCIDSLGRTPLHFSILNSQERCVRYLLTQGADPQAKDQKHWTPLHAACSIGNFEISEILLEVYEQRLVLSNQQFNYLQNQQSFF